VKRVDRLLKLLELLHAKKLTTVDQLAQQLGISTRTVYRDIQALKDLQLSVVYQSTKGYVQVAVQHKAQSLLLVVFPAAGQMAGTK